MKDFRELKVWQRAHELTLAVYQVTASFPREELYGLTAQMRRASSSIGANLAEGCGRDGGAELNRFCSIALGSASELQYFLLLAKDLHLLAGGDYDRLAEKDHRSETDAHRAGTQAESCQLRAESTG